MNDAPLSKWFRMYEKVTKDGTGQYFVAYLSCHAEGQAQRR